MKILKPILLVTVLAMCMTFSLSGAFAADKPMMDSTNNKMKSTMMDDSAGMKAPAQDEMKGTMATDMEKDAKSAMDEPMKGEMHKEMGGAMDMSGKGDMKKPMEMEKKMD